jgi:8-oxo-dGTP diphosphatase
VRRVPVVAAVVRRGDRLLLGRRPVHKRHGGLWEFPGGKIDEGESVAEAARRELAEELGLEVLAVEDRLFAMDDGASPFLIQFHPVSVVGEPDAIEHSEVGWFSPEELEAMELAPADAAFVLWLTSRDRRTTP